MTGPRAERSGRRGLLGAAGALTAGQFRAQRVQVRAPEAPEVVQPLVRLAQRLGVDGIEPPRPHRTYAGEAVVPQHLQVLRDRRLRDAVLGLHDRADLTGGELTAGEQLEDPAAHRIAEHVESVHVRRITASAYISRCRTTAAGPPASR